MEIRPAGAPVPSESPSLPQSAPPRKRVRRWHHRGFTGCSTCRRRHVRCDEASPTCNNCTRLGRECDGAQGRMTFKVYGPNQEPPSKGSKTRKKSTESDACDTIPGTGAFAIKHGRDTESSEAVVISPRTASSQRRSFRFQEPMSSRLVPASIEETGDRYFMHFIDRVSTLLIIYDNSMNSNPYRSYFPDFARSSPSMVGAMQALGALHLANTSLGPQRNLHLQHAMSKYGQVVQLFRARYGRTTQQLGMTDFATCLLLCLFEMMDSQNHNWAVHLKGAREIYNLLFYPHTGRTTTREEQRVAECNHPLRSFLVSLLSYLDVAGACATPGGTVVEGNYWKTLGGGWEYNLGTPSLSSSATPDNPTLVELRYAWSSMMEVQAAISTFARDKQWMSPEHQDMVYKEIFNSLVVWRASTPISLQLLGDMGLDDESLRQFPFPDMLEYVGYRRGVGQLAILWPLFIAGQETRNEAEQQYVRQTMEELKLFGFKNVDKGLETLEAVWFKRRTFPEGWTETLDEIKSNILLP
ncbi:hypothetical protein N7493_008447 [Penicillium malachiteum]|uniref:Zn(2)-C6 fungal-type domain-containing protein n=1 Tax=Penicillium malachiteum TaxID=1324776 RepID=A0AAD6HH54_9EURO|nr:hypothetical protein N7493_008447 [Penicillium malachiteum]